MGHAVPAPLVPPQACKPAQVYDHQRHERPAYRGLFIYAAKMADPDADLSGWMPVLRNSLSTCQNQLPADAAHGAAATRILFDALALGAITSWQEAAAFFDQLVAHQQPSGQFLHATRSDNPETHWFHELVLLQAAGSFAAHTNHTAVRDAAFAAAEFHQNETQPDHATNQPWGLLPMIQNAQTWPLADQLLHDVMMQRPGGIDGISRVLLADVLACLMGAIQ